MEKKIWLVIAIISFFTVTGLVLATSKNTSKRMRQVHFSNQEFKINNGETNIANESKINIKSEATNIKDEKIALNTQDIKYKNQPTEYTNQQTKYSDNSTYNNQSTKYKNSAKYQSQKVDLDFKNLDDSGLDAMLNHAKKKQSQPLDYGNQPIQNMSSTPVDRYMYKNIDWGKWKSDFVNKILDDSVELTCLDNYSNGAWFQYSFEVLDTGDVYNITVKSVHLTDKDKIAVKKFLKNYSHTPITRFPPNSNRKSVKVSAIVVLADETQHSSKKDFMDTERVKIKY